MTAEFLVHQCNSTLLYGRAPHRLDVEWISATAPGAVTQVYHGGYFVANADAWFSVDPMIAVVLAVQCVVRWLLRVLEREC